MSCHSGKFIHRVLSHRPSPSSAPQSISQHTRQSPFRIPPSPSPNGASAHPINSPSSRALSSQLRSQTHHTSLRSAMACEASSLRYALLLSGEGESALMRGWDSGVADEEDDGTVAFQEIF
eukprot:CCRYP_008119-RB/>CCRYP_008119-RB protein AED:0.46 eAED:0.49 QI:247/0/0.5/1/0/0.5/2/0/120